MSEPKASDLTAEERAWADAVAVALCSSGNYSAAGAISEAVTLGVPERRAMFSPAQPEPKRCENCEKPVANELDHFHSGYRDSDCTVEPHFICEQPEPKRGKVCPNCLQPGEPHYFWKTARGATVDLPDFTCKPAPPPAPVLYVCPNCNEQTATKQEHEIPIRDTGICRFTCQAAPVAGELAEAVSIALTALRDQALGEYGYVDKKLTRIADDLEACARSQEQKHRFEIKTLEAKYDNERVLRERDARSQATAQPVAVGMTPELATVIHLAELRAEIEERDHAKFQHTKTAAPEWRKAIAAVRSQAVSAQPKPPAREFPMVRRLVSKIRDWKSCVELAMHPTQLDDLCFAALAELDAQPKAVGVPPNVRELVSLLLWKIRNNQGSIAIEHYGGLLIEAQKEIDCWPERVEKGTA